MKISEGELFNATNLETSKKRITALGFFERRQRLRPSKGSVGRVRRGQRSRSSERVHRHLPDRRRVLLGRELHRPGPDVAEQPVRPRPDAGVPDAQLSEPASSCSCCASSSRTSSTPTGPSRSTCTTRAAASARSRVTPRAARSVVGLPAVVRGARVPDLQARGRRASPPGGLGLRPTSARVATPLEAQSVANLFRGGVTSSLKASLSWDSRNNRLFPTERLVPPPCSPSTPSEYTGSENKFVRWGGFTRYYRERLGPVRAQGQRRGRRHHQHRSARRADQRALPHRRHLRRPRVSAAARSGPSCARQPAGRRRPAARRAVRSAATCSSSGTARSSSRCSSASASPASLFYDMGNAYNLEDRYCSGLSRTSSVDLAQVRPVLRPRLRLAHLRASASSVGFGFRWFSRRSARSGSSGASRSTARPRVTRSSLVFEFTIGNFF
jgi:hypothetical protein